MSTDQNRANLVSRIETVWNEGTTDDVEDLLAPDHVAYGTSLGTLEGRDAFEQYVTLCRSAYPDFRYQLDPVDSHGNYRVCRWTVESRARDSDPQPAAEQVALQGTTTLRFADGRVDATVNPCDPWRNHRPTDATSEFNPPPEVSFDA